MVVFLAILFLYILVCFILSVSRRVFWFFPFVSSFLAFFVLGNVLFYTIFLPIWATHCFDSNAAFLFFAVCWSSMFSRFFTVALAPLCFDLLPGVCTIVIDLLICSSFFFLLCVFFCSFLAFQLPHPTSFRFLCWRFRPVYDAFNLVLLFSGLFTIYSGLLVCLVSVFGSTAVSAFLLAMLLFRFNVRGLLLWWVA